MHIWVEHDAIKDPPKHYKLVLVRDGECGLLHIAHRCVNPEAWVAVETGMRLHYVSSWWELPKED